MSVACESRGPGLHPEPRSVVCWGTDLSCRRPAHPASCTFSSKLGRRGLNHSSACTFSKVETQWALRASTAACWDPEEAFCREVPTVHPSASHLRSSPLQDKNISLNFRL